MASHAPTQSHRPLERGWRLNPTEAPSRADGPAVERLAYRLNDLAIALRVSRRTIERERSAGRFPKPDRHIGKTPLWSVATIRRLMTKGGESR